jgi:hypothetical protein
MEAAQPILKQVIHNLVFVYTVVAVVVAPGNEDLIDKTCFLKLKAVMEWHPLLPIPAKLSMPQAAVAELTDLVAIMQGMQI